MYFVCCYNNFCALIMASTSSEDRDKWDWCNVEVSLDKMRTSHVLSASTSSGPRVK